ncbi:MAG: M20/M25/M40 family metallo-hydrolase [Hyphomonadaceae bacterium]
MIKVLLATLAALGLTATSASAEPSAEERARSLEIFRHIIGLDTSVEGQRTPEMAAYLAAHLRDASFPEEDIHVIPFEHTAALVVRWRGDGSGGRSIVLMAHMDVVTAHRSDWERDPFTLIEEDGFFFGRGTLDNKAGIANLVSTFIQLRSEGFTPTRDLILAFTGDEETDPRTAQLLLDEHRDLLGDPEFALNSDAGGGGLRPNGTPSVYVMQTAEKTFATYTLTAHNPGGHSSAPRADNAIYDLSQALERLRAYAFPVRWNDTTIASLRDNAGAVGGDLGAAMARFARRPGDARAAARISREPSMVGQVRTTCVATRLEAGHADNALPQSAVATVNCRIFPGTSIEEVQARLQDIAGDDIEIALKVGLPASDPSPLREDVMAAVARAVHQHYPDTPITPAQSAYYTDGMFYRAAGIPTYGVGEIFIRSSDAFAHGLNERIPAEAFYNGLDHWRSLLTDLAGPR